SRACRKSTTGIGTSRYLMTRSSVRTIESVATTLTASMALYTLCEIDLGFITRLCLVDATDIHDRVWFLSSDTGKYPEVVCEVSTRECAMCSYLPRVHPRPHPESVYMKADRDRP